MQLRLLMMRKKGRMRAKWVLEKGSSYLYLHRFKNTGCTRFHQYQADCPFYQVTLIILWSHSWLYLLTRKLILRFLSTKVRSLQQTFLIFISRKYRFLNLKCTYSNLKDVDQDILKEQILIQDFTFLLKSCCHLQKRLSQKSKYFL